VEGMISPDVFSQAWPDTRLPSAFAAALRLLSSC